MVDRREARETVPASSIGRCEMSDFYGINIALSSLYAQRQGLETTGHNIANAETEGYSRQKVDMSATSGNAVPAVYSVAARGGSGVHVTRVERIRDAFLDIRSLEEHSSFEKLKQLRQVHESVESFFNEPGENGIQALLSEYWNAWDDVANNPIDVSARQVLVERGQTLAAALREVDADLDVLRDTILSRLKAEVPTVSEKFLQIADLNQAIEVANMSELGVNDLLDQRDLLIKEVAKKTGLRIRPGENGQMNLFLGGAMVVNNNSAMPVHMNTNRIPPLVEFAVSGLPVEISTGAIGAMLQVVDNTAPGLIERLRGQLDEVARELVASVNAMHVFVAGTNDTYTLDGKESGTFFLGTDAKSVKVDPDVAQNPRLVAAGLGNAAFNGENALRLAEVGSETEGIDAGYRRMIVDFGVEARAVDRRYDVQYGLVRQVDAARSSAAEVSLDEEMANMVRFQRAYEAAAKFLSTVDQLLGTLLSLAR